MPKKIVIRLEGMATGSWMVTFSDLITLLLTFFVLLFSMSSLASDTFTEIFNQESGEGLGLLASDSRAHAGHALFDPIPEINKSDLRNSLLQALSGGSDLSGEPGGIPDGVEILIDETTDGVIQILMIDSLLFRPGSTELTEEAVRFLGLCRNFLQLLFRNEPRRIVIEGHTDDTLPPEESSLLSARRAMTVLSEVLKEGNLPPELFSIIGYGASRPLLPNDSDENRAKNRHVSIIIQPVDRRIDIIDEM